MRNPGRTATTAAALMVGLGLVVFVAVFANGIKASVSDTIDDLVTADLIVRSDTFQPIPAGAQEAVAEHRDAGHQRGLIGQLVQPALAQAQLVAAVDAGDHQHRHRIGTGHP